MVVGGGNSAGQAAVYLAGRTRRVYLLIRGGDLAKAMSRYLVDQVMDAGNVELLPDTEVRELLGEDRLEGIVVEDHRLPAALRSGHARTVCSLRSVQRYTSSAKCVRKSTSRARRCTWSIAGAVPLK